MAERREIKMADLGSQRRSHCRIVWSWEPERIRLGSLGWKRTEFVVRVCP
jgi:hypothetical protein